MIAGINLLLVTRLQPRSDDTTSLHDPAKSLGRYKRSRRPMIVGINLGKLIYSEIDLLRNRSATKTDLLGIHIAEAERHVVERIDDAQGLFTFEDLK